MSDIPNYRLLDRYMSQGRIIPFLGAGASFGTRNPSKKPWLQGKHRIALPSGSELAAWLAKEASFPEKNAWDLAKVSQFFDTTIGRADLQEALNEIFAFDQKPSAIHKYMAEAAKSAPQLIVTTNYDDLIERAFAEAKQPYDVVVHVVRATEQGMIVWRKHGQAPVELLAKNCDPDFKTTNVIYKIHGAIDRDVPPKYAHYVITEDDYVDFLSRMPKVIPSTILEQLQKRHFLFIGYALQDWNVRVVLNQLTKLRGPLDHKSWAIETLKKPVEKTLWGARNVTVYDETSIDAFVKRLRAARGKP